MTWKPSCAKWPALRTMLGCAPTATNPSHWRNREKQLPHPGEAEKLPPFPFSILSSFQATAHHFPSQILPWVCQQDICRDVLGSRATATTGNPPVVRVPLCPHRHSCQSRSHIFGLTIPPDAGREKLNKTPWWDDVKKELSHCSWGS